MSKSGVKGKVYISAPGCASDNNTAGDASSIQDEVTKFTFVESVAKKSFPHDKSGGWMTNCYGARGLEITLEAAIRLTQGYRGIPSVGQKVYVELYPFGTECGEPVACWAGIDRITTICDQGAGGEPVGYTATLSSDGPVSGLSSTEGDDWGGFECECDEDGSAAPVGSGS